MSRLIALPLARVLALPSLVALWEDCFMRFSLVVCQRVSRKHHASGHEDGADKKPGTAVQFLRRVQNLSTKLRNPDGGRKRTSTPRSSAPACRAALAWTLRSDLV
ncbi:MAG: hypothetical protein H0W24_10080 [Lysobacter sp.]|nr:hypothetical protein [Lysobacter sp.]